ncbi:hypothetical protein F889_02923 [Acinetobacter colistiniresistens]|uniref:Uncharacterized protein n=1 Tax=Acinetobacter colistiniresistens TaxID=280145 RepID=N9PL22_9GAMM|nr:zonular occludens toxin domain-containing protein [Acinetobacter colistiniresistens]ENX34259.1 hypothetical protein F889_02923 [Acinetobacter colistiniresistens]
MSTLRLITGGIGTGKSLWTVDQLFQLKDKEPDRKVYTDITGIQHTGIISVPADFDWRDAENNSLIVFDEVQYKELFSRHNSKRDQQILDLTTIRKRGIELWVITQRARFLNADVLGLVNEHVHLEKKAKKASKVFIFQEAETTITQKKKMFAFKKYVYQYPEHLYGFYESIKEDAKHHTRSWVHQGIILVLITMAIALIGIGITVYKGYMSSDLAKQQQAAAETAKPSETQNAAQPTQGTTSTQQSSSNSVEKISYNPNRPYQFDYEFQYEVKDKPQLAGCIIFKNECTCYTQQATKLEMTQKDCKRYMSGDRPFNAFRQPSMQQQYQQQQQQQYQQQYPPSDPQKFDAEYAAKVQQAKQQGLI